MRQTFKQEMQEIKDEVLLLGSMVEYAVLDSIQALRDSDPEQSQIILQKDLAINRKRYDIEMAIMILIASQQPVTHDLRRLAASLNVCTELERIGDYAKGIATINLRSQGLGMPFIMSAIQAMALDAVNMLHQAMTTYANEDITTAIAVMSSDDLIDANYEKIYATALHHVFAHPHDIERINYVIWVAHNLERLGDRATNICEQVTFIVSGERYPMTIPVHPSA